MTILFSVIGFLIAITVHEFMHAWTANYLGDPTAKREGRVSLNPIPHMDPLGTMLLPAVLILTGSPIVIGWAKPVHINPNNFKNPRLGSALSAFAGPMANLLMVLAMSAIYRIPAVSASIWGGLVLAIIIINLILMIFNLIPIPPLDGSKVFSLVFPKLEDPRLETFGPIIILAVLLLGQSYIWAVVSFFIRLLGLDLNFY